MKRDVEIDKRLLRVKPDEIYSQMVRHRSGKLITLRKFALITTGEISKSELFTAMRKLSIE